MTQFLPYASIPILLGLGGLLLASLSDPVCAPREPNVLDATRSAQLFFETHGRFPDEDSFRPGQNRDAAEPDQTFFLHMDDRLDLAHVSNAGDREFFFYFESNCKLRVFPDRHEVYPRRP